jgi:beta-glucosidase-like glycosyl hydrolase
MMNRTLVLVLCLVLTGAFSYAQGDRWVDSTLARLNIEERVGQLFVVEFVGLYTHENDQAYRYAVEMVTRYHVGSLILGGGTILDIATITNRLQTLARVPLLINGDFEAGAAHGGYWRRSRGWTDRLPALIPGGGTQFVSQMAIGATRNPRYAYELGRITAREARAIGVHWSNSPVADVNSNADNPVINTRSFGEDPAAVAEMVGAYVHGAQEAGLIATLKHFPGHGDTRDDSHMRLPVLPFDAARLRAVEFVPFKAGIAAGAKAVMTSHLALPRIDPSGRPATLSVPVLTGFLRGELGFDGIVVTDGMRMQGITDQYGSAEASVLALEAGADAVLGIEDIDKGYQGVLAAVRSGRLSEERITASVRRILAAKYWVGLSVRRTVPLDSIFTIVGDPESMKISATISDASVTLLRNAKELLPLAGTARVCVVTVTEDPAPYIGTELVRELQSFVDSVDVVRVSNESGPKKFERLDELSGTADVMVVGIYLSVVAWRGGPRFSEPLERFLASLNDQGKPVVLVAFGDPYILGKIPETAVVMTPYNGTYVAEQSVARAISGRIRISGTLPVTIPGRYARGAGMTLMSR